MYEAGNIQFSENQITQLAVSRLGLKSKAPIYPSTHSVMVKCPFHHDKTPSMSINFDKGLYHCFSCGRGGHISSLYWEMTGESLYKALGIKTDAFSAFSRMENIGYDSLFLRTQEPDPEDSYRLRSVHVVYDPSQIHEVESSQECMSYLRRRGIPLSVAHAMKMKYAEEVEFNGTRYIHRLLIPVYEKGGLISVEGRRIRNTDEAKVLYCYNGTVDTLYDLDHLDLQKPVYACEGLMDLVQLRKSSSTQNSTSIFGANLTRRQLHLIGKCKQFIYIEDLDEAGSRTLAKLRESGLRNIYHLTLPKSINGSPVKDLGDLVKAQSSVDDLIRHKWLRYIKPLF